jgi:HSP20 family protein
MYALARRAALARFPVLFGWLESPWASLLPFAPARTFRVEDYHEDGRYVVRAELPGLDPEKDIEVTADAGILAIRAERRGTQGDAPLGVPVRLAHPVGHAAPGADAEKITASYSQGILEVGVPIPEQAKPERHRIAIQHPR